MSRWRKLEVNGEKWCYTVGSSTVAARHEDGRKFTASVESVRGRDADTFEKGRYKGTDDGMIKPGKVRVWLEREIRQASAVGR